MPDGDISRLSAIWQTAGGATVVNTFHFRQLGTVAGNPLAALAGDFISTQPTTYKVVVSSLYSLVQVNVEDVVPGTAATYTTGAGLPIAGSSTGDALPPQDTSVITITTALKGRSFRGRLYFPPTGEGNQAGGTFTSGYTTALTTWMDALVGRYITNAATSKFALGVVSRYSNGVKRVTPIFTPAVFYTVHGIARSQRRRQLGVGS